MSEMKHTKGEFKDGTTGWKVGIRETNGTKGFEIHYSDDGECVTDHVYTKEDADLIAAAPDILEAMVAMKEYCKYHDIRLGSGIIHQLELAISKATGDKG